MMMPTRRMFGMRRPMGCTLSVPIIATGITGTPVASTSFATPVLPRYRRPSGLRVPSG